MKRIASAAALISLAVAPTLADETLPDQPAFGLKSIDAMVPIGRGQRELIIGDRKVAHAAAKGVEFRFADSSGPANPTKIWISDDLIIIDLGDGERIFGDLAENDIYTPGPEGQHVSLRAMRDIVGAVRSPGDRSSRDALTDQELDALFEGMPEPTIGILRTRFASLPRSVALPAIQGMRQKMNLPEIRLSDPTPQEETGPVKTGKTATLGGIAVYEVVSGEVSYWVADPQNVPQGREFVTQMTKFEQLHRDISGAGSVFENKSIFGISEVGGFPVEVRLPEGNSVRYVTSTEKRLGDALPFEDLKPLDPR